MPASYQGPRLVKGALVSVDPTNPTPEAIEFHYNPASLRRTIQPQMAGGDQAEHSDAVRFTGAPIETINVDIELDAVDQLEAGDTMAATMGIYPQLVSLELLVYPKVSQVVQNAAALSLGNIEVVPILAPQTLFVWGARRVFPVRLESMSVTEEAFDPDLNPVRATVSLGMRVLTYSDLDPSTRGYHQFLAHQTSMEALARQAASRRTSNSMGINVGQL